jgi:hypothetical protein
MKNEKLRKITGFIEFRLNHSVIFQQQHKSMGIFERCIVLCYKLYAQLFSKSKNET